jgi:hypothetical protein
MSKQPENFLPLRVKSDAGCVPELSREQKKVKIKIENFKNYLAPNLSLFYLRRPAENGDEEQSAGQKNSPRPHTELF